MSAPHHVILHYTGRVQGVGFRYQTLQVAKGYEVSGYVQNLPDGRVRLEVRGEPAELEAFLTAVAEQMDGYIRKAERTAGTGEGRFQGFVLR